MARRKAWEREEEREQERLDYRAALTPWVLVNLNRDVKKHPEPYPIEDFVLSRPKRKPQTPAQIAAMAAANNATLGGVDMRCKVIRASEEEKQVLLARLKAKGNPVEVE